MCLVETHYTCGAVTWDAIWPVETCDCQEVVGHEFVDSKYGSCGKCVADDDGFFESDIESESDTESESDSEEEPDPGEGDTSLDLGDS